MIVIKFGGASIGNAAKIQNLKTIVKQNISKKPIVVVSAVNGITDMLIASSKEAVEGKFSQYENIVKKHKKLLQELNLPENTVDSELEELSKGLNEISQTKKLTKRTLDYIMSFGERMSSKIISSFLNNYGIKAKPFNSWDIGLMTDSNFGSANVVEKSLEVVRTNLLHINEIPIITGFIGKDKNGEITTLGRDGSDFTASLLGSALEAEEIQVWKDVSGLMTADPRLVTEAKCLDKISFEEAAEIAFFGTKVLHPKTIEPAVKKQIPVKILNICDPTCKGTTIFEHIDNEEGIKAIAFKRHVVLFNVTSSKMLYSHGFLKKLFAIFDKYCISVDMISTSEISVSLTIDNYESDEQLNEIKKELENFSKVSLKRNMAIICVIGKGLRYNGRISAEIFRTLAEQNVNIEMISQGASKISIGLVIKNNALEKCVKSLHRSFWG